MKIALFGIARVPLGKHNLKDPRLETKSYVMQDFDLATFRFSK